MRTAGTGAADSALGEDKGEGEGEGEDVGAEAEGSEVSLEGVGGASSCLENCSGAARPSAETMS